MNFEYRIIDTGTSHEAAEQAVAAYARAGWRLVAMSARLSGAVWVAMEREAVGDAASSIKPTPQIVKEQTAVPEQVEDARRKRMAKTH